MNEKKSTGFAALILSVVVALVAVFGVRFVGGTASQEEEIPGGETVNEGGTFSATERGYGGDVTVTLTVGADGTITDAVIDGPDETPGIGGAAIEQMQPQILEKQGVPDAVSGASRTSEAVIAAVQSCLDQAAGGGAGSSAAGAYVPGEYTATAQGMGDVTVTITIGDDGSIADVVIDGPDETPGIGSTAIEQLQPAILEAQSADVDVIASATITSNAVIEAAQSCLDQAGGGAGSSAAGAYGPGEDTATAQGVGDITVTITIGDDGSIADVVIDGPDETPGIGSTAIEQLQPAILEAQSADVDVIASATITSNAVIEAVQSCLDQAAGN